MTNRYLTSIYLKRRYLLQASFWVVSSIHVKSPVSNPNIFLACPLLPISIYGFPIERGVSVSQLSILFLHLPGAFDCHAPNVSTCIPHDHCQALIRQRYTAVSCKSTPHVGSQTSSAFSLSSWKDETKKHQKYHCNNFTFQTETKPKDLSQFSRNNSKKHLNFSDIFFW